MKNTWTVHKVPTVAISIRSEKLEKGQKVVHHMKKELLHLSFDRRISQGFSHTKKNIYFHIFFDLLIGMKNSWENIKVKYLVSKQF